MKMVFLTYAIHKRHTQIHTNTHIRALTHIHTHQLLEKAMSLSPRRLQRDAGWVLNDPINGALGLVVTRVQLRIVTDLNKNLNVILVFQKYEYQQKSPGPIHQSFRCIKAPGNSISLIKKASAFGYCSSAGLLHTTRHPQSERDQPVKGLVLAFYCINYLKIEWHVGVCVKEMYFSNRLLTILP